MSYTLRQAKNEVEKTKEKSKVFNIAGEEYVLTKIKKKK